MLVCACACLCVRVISVLFLRQVCISLSGVNPELGQTLASTGLTVWRAAQEMARFMWEHRLGLQSFAYMHVCILCVYSKCMLYAARKLEEHCLSSLTDRLVCLCGARVTVCVMNERRQTNRKPPTQADHAVKNRITFISTQSPNTVLLWVAFFHARIFICQILLSGGASS